MPQSADAKLGVIQVGMNTSDMAGSLRLYAEAFGFVNAGSQGMWGQTIAVQGLPPDSRTLIWWMIGSQSYFQLELFHHTRPEQRPLRTDWRPSDHGWSRIGVSVTDFDACMSALAANAVTPLTPPITENGKRRMAFRDPYVGVVVEVMEKWHTAGGDGPAVVYVASSVSDLTGARTFYGDVIGLEICPGDLLHKAKHEALWGLADAKRDVFVARAEDMLLEIVQYDDPAGRPRPADYRVSDQGIVNVALGSRQANTVAAAIDRVKAAGFVPPAVFNAGGIVWGSLTDPEREIELGCVPPELDAALGFTAAAPFQT